MTAKCAIVGIVLGVFSEKKRRASEIDRKSLPCSGPTDCADKPVATVDATMSYCVHGSYEASVGCCTRQCLRRPGPSLQVSVRYHESSCDERATVGGNSCSSGGKAM